MSSSTCFLSWLTLSIVLITSKLTMAADSATEAKIDTLCHQIEEFGFCSQTFHQNLKGGSADYVGLTQIATNQAYSNATNTLGYIEQLLRSTTDPALKNDLIVCENAFKIVKQAFGEALKLFSQRDYRGMLSAERPTPRAQASCDVIFSTPPARHSPIMDERNREMRILIAMAITSGSNIH
ncbi:putative invertase inhibitor [Cucumis melo var. makuwa]|uniref:Invertase inhibitor n=1 Tax=Cucumis melo var. makuwa TaxID=1194695 RepID=A0A5A7ULL2_CUCMM|nr:putative invertase inhibitor [Cucumis melo var. makuwa]TYJ96433.1 putative invertase inhibitor [Cucumis melo var. makuwa]